MASYPKCPLCGENHPNDMHGVDEIRKEKVRDVLEQLRKTDLSLEHFLANDLINAMMEGRKEIIIKNRLSKEEARYFVMGQIAGILKVYYDVRKILEDKK